MTHAPIKSVDGDTGLQTRVRGGRGVFFFFFQCSLTLSFFIWYDVFNIG
jgi:hypothetical protein